MPTTLSLHQVSGRICENENTPTEWKKGLGIKLPDRQQLKPGL
jgi:hypothetical protein